MGAPDRLTAEWVHEHGLPRPQRTPTPSAPGPRWPSATHLRDLPASRRSLADRLDVDRLPYSIKVILENLLRHEDGAAVSAGDIEAVAAWGDNPERHGQGAGRRSTRSPSPPNAC